MVIYASEVICFETLQEMRDVVDTSLLVDVAPYYCLCAYRNCDRNVDKAIGWLKENGYVAGLAQR